MPHFYWLIFWKQLVAKALSARYAWSDNCTQMWPAQELTARVQMEETPGAAGPGTGWTLRGTH